MLVIVSRMSIRYVFKYRVFNCDQIVSVFNTPVFYLNRRNLELYFVNLFLPNVHKNKEIVSLR